MKNNTLIKVLIAIILAGIAGWLSGPTAEIFGVPYVKIYDLIGQLFLNALTLVVVPLVASSIITGTARMGSDEAFGKLGGKTFGFFVLNVATAILVGILVITLFRPGEGVTFPQETNSAVLKALESQAQGDIFDKFAAILLKIVPSNILAVASQGQMLGLIFFSILFGYYISKIDRHNGSIVLGLFTGIFEIMMKITHLVMKALPIGVFGLVAKVVATTGLESIYSVAWFFLAAIVGLFLHMVVVQSLFLKFIARVNPLLHFQAMGPAILTAFSTSSSAATLPIAIECVEKRAGISNRITSFALPLGVSLNTAGTALYVCISAFFIAQAYGVELNFATQVMIALMAFLTSFGIAGIPSGCLVALVIVLHSIGIPAEGIGLVLVVERFLDMGRTIVNTFCNSCSSVLIARSEGEPTYLVAAHG